MVSKHPESTGAPHCKSILSIALSAIVQLGASNTNGEVRKHQDTLVLRPLQYNTCVGPIYSRSIGEVVRDYWAAVLTARRATGERLHTVSGTEIVHCDVLYFERGVVTFKYTPPRPANFFVSRRSSTVLFGYMYVDQNAALTLL